MMELLKKVDPGTARRWVLGLASMTVLALNKKLGLELDTAAQGFIASIAVALIVGSNYKATKLKAP